MDEPSSGWFAAAAERSGQGGDPNAVHRAMLESMLDAHVLMEAIRDQDGIVVDFRYVEANNAAAAYYRLPREELIGSTVMELFPAVRSTPLWGRYVHVVDSGEPLELDDNTYQHKMLPGARHFDIRGVKVGDAIAYTWRDVTERFERASRLMESEERYRLLAENISDVVVHVRDDVMVWVSPSLEAQLGWSRSDWIGAVAADFIHPDDVPVTRESQRRLRSGRSLVVLARVRAADGTYHWVEANAKTYEGADGNPDGEVVSFRIVDAKVAAEKELQRRVLLDDLTGSLNRDAALERLSALVDNTRTPGSESGVLFVDLDDFKAVNDRLGHVAGDTVLKVTADRIRDRIRDTDVIARMGGDEFLIILNDLHTLEEAVDIAEDIRSASEQPITVPGGTLTATISVGVTLRRDDDEPDTLIARADSAMYRAKRTGRNQVVAIPEP